MDLTKLLHDVVNGSDVSAVQTLVAMSVDVNSMHAGLSPLHTACLKGDAGMVAEILRHGGDTELWVSVLPQSEPCVADSTDSLCSKQDLYDSSTALIIAVRLNNIEIVKLLIAYGSDLEAVDENGKTPLIWACQLGHKDIIHLLLKHGASFIRSGNFVPLFEASAKGHNCVIDIILQAGVPLNLLDSKHMNVLHYAAMNGQTETVRYLMAKQCPLVTSTGEVTSAFLAATNGHLDVLKVLAENKRVNSLIRQSNCDSESPLHMAAKHGHLDILDFLLNLGCDINQGNWTGHTPLCYAVTHGRSEVVELLVNRGCDSNIPKIPYLPPIFQARHDLHIVKTLVKGGADVNVVDMADGSLLMYAAGQHSPSSLELLEFLLENGASVDQQCFWGETALFKAIVSSNLSAMRLLVKHGSNVNIRNARAFTPLQVAVSRGLTECVQLLIKAGADLNQKVAFSKETILEFALMKGAKLNLCRLLHSAGAVVQRDFHSTYFSMLKDCKRSHDRAQQSREVPLKSRNAEDHPLSDFTAGTVKHSWCKKRKFSKGLDEPYESLMSELLEPLCLQNLLRNFVRNTLTFDDDSIDKLPIPPLLKRFLCFHESMQAYM